MLSQKAIGFVESYPIATVKPRIFLLSTTTTNPENIPLTKGDYKVIKR